MILIDMVNIYLTGKVRIPFGEIKNERFINGILVITISIGA